MSLYAATIPVFQQILGSVRGLIGKAEAFCAESGLSPDAIIQARIAEDMFPFAYQVKSTVVHSAGALEGVRKGVFSPDLSEPPATFDALRAKIDEGLAALASLTAAEVDAFTGGDMRFEFRDFSLPFTAENFLYSFSLPNFHFHATTAYDILRMKGLPVGKRDYLGNMLIRA